VKKVRLDKYDLLKVVVKVLVYTSIGVGAFYLLLFDYDLGAKYCIINNIPTDFSLTYSGIGMANGIALILFLIEVTIFFCFLKLLNKISIFKKIFKFLDFEILDFCHKIND